MLPANPFERIEKAKAVAKSLRDDAARKVADAQAIDALVEALEQALFAAQINHETILESRK